MMDALEEELIPAKVDWLIAAFGRGVHSFRDPVLNSGSARYDDKPCRAAHLQMPTFFAETL
jgi:hypothetical protein